jgi:pilus assembly protein Flp/PilA
MRWDICWNWRFRSGNSTASAIAASAKSILHEKSVLVSSSIWLSGIRGIEAGANSGPYHQLNFYHLILSLQRLPILRVTGELHWRSPICELTENLMMKKIFYDFMVDESGATAIEYGLIAAGISLAIIAVVNGLGTKLNTKFTAINNSLK